MKRFPYANIYDRGENKFKAVLGGVPNVAVDLNNNLKPMDNRIIGSPGNTIYKVARGQGKTFIQDRTSNKYLTRLETLTGESLEITMPNLPAATPLILPDGVSIKWTFPQGHTITQYVTEKHLKEIVFQKKNIPILFRYKPTGLDVVKKEYTLEFYSKKTGKLVYKTERPYFEENGDIKYVDLQIQKVNSNWHITYLTYNKDREIDPTIVFGETGGAAIGGDHKDTFIQGGDTDHAWSTDRNLYVTTLLVSYSLLRFSLVGHIPTNAIVNTAVLKLTTRLVAGAFNVNVHRLTTDWGVTPVDEGVTQAVAAAGQATWRRSFDFNGAGGDVTWAAGNFGAGDYVAGAEDTELCNVVNTDYFWNIPIMVQLWIQNDATNYGMVCISPDGGANSFSSQEDILAVERPSLTVDYSLPVSARRILESKISIPVGIGMR